MKKDILTMCLGGCALAFSAVFMAVALMTIVGVIMTTVGVVSQ